MYFLYGAVHGSEWEPSYGLLTLARLLAEGKMNDVIDLDKAAVKILPILNPFGYDHYKRQNANGVDLCVQGASPTWDKITGEDTNKDGRYGPWDSMWKGEHPYSEPESQTLKKIADEHKPFFSLELHGNSSGDKYNWICMLPVGALPDNHVRAMRWNEELNDRVLGRYVLRQLYDKDFSLYHNKLVKQGGCGTLASTTARDNYGIVIELTCGYRDSYGTVLQTDLVCEICRAIFIAYPPDNNEKNRDE